MMKIIKDRQHITETRYLRTFLYRDNTGCGLSFDCDEYGNVDQRYKDNSNYLGCLRGEVDGREVVDAGVTTWENSYTIPAVGLCSCGGTTELHGFTSTCDRCGADYNSSGQRLADRSQWGEETGEHPADIAMIP